MDADPHVELKAALADLEQQVAALRRAVRQGQRALLAQWEPWLSRRAFREGAEHLAAYLALRRHDLRPLQTRLAVHGLSSLNRSAGHVLPALDTLLTALKLMLGKPVDAGRARRQRRAMDHHGDCVRQRGQLLGPTPAGRAVRIMVTLPTEAAADYPLVRELILRGMDCARIDCAHDGPQTWARMAVHVRRAAEETGRSCRVLMDLAGPRVRIGPVKPGPAVLHVKPGRDSLGRLIEPARLILDASGAPGRPARRDAQGRLLPARAAVPRAFLEGLQPGDVIRTVDARGRDRDLTVRVRLTDREVLADAEAGFYLTPGTRLERARPPVPGEDETRTSCLCGPIEPEPLKIHLRPGDPLHLTRAPTPGEPAGTEGGAGQAASAHVPCLPPEVFDFLAEGQPVLIDGGRIAGRIEHLDGDGALLRIVRARPEGEMLHPDSAVHFPESPLGLPALTPKDRADLDFVVEHADMVGLPFVQSGEDMDQLVEALAARRASHLGIVARIETRRAVEHLPEIIVRGAGRHPFGVMIGCGEPALETGCERPAAIQEELLSLCEAAHVPVIRSTRWPEGLARRGLPSFPRLTDATPLRAGCVMISAGPFVLDAIALLDEVVECIEADQEKKPGRCRALPW